MYGMKKTFVRNCRGTTRVQSDREDLLIFLCSSHRRTAAAHMHMPCTEGFANAQELSISMLNYTLEQWTGAHPCKA